MTDAEVRLQLLRLAQSILGESYQQEQNKAYERFLVLLPKGKESEVVFPSTPTSEKILLEARKLEAFVFPTCDGEG